MVRLLKNGLGVESERLTNDRHRLVTNAIKLSITPPTCSSWYRTLVSGVLVHLQSCRSEVSQSKVLER